MKKLAICLFLLFFVVAGSYAVAQSQIGKQLIQKAITNALEQSDFTVHIERIDGTLPHQINLKEVKLEGRGVEVEIATLKLRPILWRLLKKELAFSDVEAQGVSVAKGQPFDFRGKVRFDAHKIHVKGAINDWDVSFALDRETQEALFSAQNELLLARGKALFTPDFAFRSSNIHLSVQRKLFSNIHIEKNEGLYTANASWEIPSLEMKGKGEMALEGRTATGSLTIDPFAESQFKLTYEPNGLLTGTSQIDIANLQSLHLPDIYGKLQIKAEWDVVDGTQVVRLDAEANDFYYTDLFAQTLKGHAEWKDPFHGFNGPLSLEASELKWDRFHFNTATFETTLQKENPFRFFAEGEALELFMDGSWEGNLSVELENCNGTYLGTAFELEEPLSFKKTETLFQIPKAKFSIGDGSLFLQIDRQNETTDAKVLLDQVPLNFFSPLSGTLSLDTTLSEKNGELRGDLEAKLHQTAPFVSEGTFTGHFNHDLLKLKGDLSPLLHLDVLIPIHLSLWPFEANILFHKDAEGTIAINGRIEELLDLFNIGPHRLEGECQGEFAFKNTLYRPLVQGRLIFNNGSYENYYSGTYLQNIHAELFAEKNILYLRKLTAEDQTGIGMLSGDGEIRLLQSDLYPFRFDLTFNQLQFVEIDLVDARAAGKVRIEGNALSAVAKGNVLIQKCALTIPDHIPRPLPHLKVTYRNQINPVAPPEKTYKPYPLHLDVNVSAPTDVSISGRGLSSDWKGEFHLGGTATALAAKGKLELNEGQFSFSSRTFKLTEGSLSLSGIEHQMPHLNIAATTETKGIQITARLSGPLDNPQITLQSSPPLPLGSIMSYLLFGQDISEIGGFQALEIASSLASLAGTGPDVMENTRRSLGIDRLRVISDPDAEGGETVSIQVGKYVAKGVLVTLTQGTDESSTNISVEVELKNNFVFQIESDQDQEQGKFTLKWSLNY